MLRVHTLASDLLSPRASKALEATLLQRLAAAGVPVEPSPGDAEALLLLTGGSERRALDALAESGARLLLAHLEHNSLAAALELSARLHQLHRPHRLLLLDEEGLAHLARVAPLVEANASLRGARLGLVGGPSEWLVASSPAPEVLHTTWGVHTVHIPWSEVDEGELLPALEALLARHRLDALSLRCFDLLAARRTTACLPLSLLNDRGVVTGCEGDLPAALTMMWTRAHTGQVPWMANPQHLDPRTGTLELAHCAAAPSLLEQVRLDTHFESGLGVGVGGRMPPGPATVARLGGVRLEELQVWDAEIVPTPLVAHRCRTQVRLRVEGSLRPLVAHPLGNHLVLVRGHAAERLREAHALHLGSD